MRRFLLPLAALLLTAQGGQNFPQGSPQGNRNPNVRVPLLALLPNGPHPDQIGSGQLAGSKGETLTFTRATTKTCPTSSSTVVSVASGQPCVGPSGLLAEPAHTNYQQESQTLDTGWTTRGTTVTANIYTAPDGTVTGDRVAGLGVPGVNDFYYGNVGNLPAGPYSLSFYVYPTVSSGVLRGGSSTGNPGVFTVDLTALPANTWTRVYVGHPAVTLTQAFVADGTSGNGAYFAATSGGPLTVGIWGVQLETGSVVHSYVPTTGAAATSNADVARLPFTSLPTARGSVLLDYTPLWSTGAAPADNDQVLFDTGNGGTSGATLDIEGGALLAFCGGNVVVPASAQTWVAGQRYRIRLVWGAGVVSIYRDGVLLKQSTGLTVNVAHTSLTVGSQGTVHQAEGFISNLQVTR